MSPANELTAAGFMVNAALLLGGLIAAGLVIGNHAVVGFALASAGTSAICYFAQLCNRRVPALFAMLLSWGFAVASAGILLRSFVA